MSKPSKSAEQVARVVAAAEGLPTGVATVGRAWDKTWRTRLSPDDLAGWGDTCNRTRREAVKMPVQS